VTVNNRGGLGAPTARGIEVISIGGQSDGEFNLNSDYTNAWGKSVVVAGAYAYSLDKEGGNYYLASRRKDAIPLTPIQPLPPHPEPSVLPELPAPVDPEPVAEPEPYKPAYQAGVPLYIAGSSAIAQLNRRECGGISTRMGGAGQLRSDNASTVPDDAGDGKEGRSRLNYVWGRVMDRYSSFEPNNGATSASFSMSESRTQIGIDGQLAEISNRALFASIWADMLDARVKTSADGDDGGNGTVHVRGYGFGGALSWYGDDGLYL